MDKREHDPNQRDTFPTLSQPNLSSTIDVPLQHILLEQGPKRNQRNPAPRRSHCQVTSRTNNSGCGNYNHSYKSGKEEKLQGLAEVVNPETNIFQSFSINAMRDQYE